jgi:hypothetical protein
VNPLDDVFRTRDSLMKVYQCCCVFILVAPAMSVESLIVEYESRLNKLTNWPDKSVIYELSSFALRHTHISNHIADILISRIIDVLLPHFSFLKLINSHHNFLSPPPLS